MYVNNEIVYMFIFYLMLFIIMCTLHVYMYFKCNDCVVCVCVSSIMDWMSVLCLMSCQE